VKTNNSHFSETQDVVQAAVKGTKWVLLSSFVSYACYPIFTIILARLLVPSDFGLLAYAMIFMGVVKLIQDIGLRQALIQKKGDIEASADVVFTINFVLGILWYLGTFFVAPFLAEFFNDFRVVNILRVMALSFLIIPFGAVQNTLLKKHLQFDKLFFLELIATLIPGIASIVLALSGHGVWSLVYGSLIGSMLNVFVTWFLVAWKPKLRFDRSCAGQMLKFGGAVSAESLLSWAVNTVDDALVGKWLGSAALGFYTVGFNIGIAPAKYISSSLLNVAFPAFSKLQDNKDAVRHAFLKAVKFISLITFPLGAIIAVTASQFVPVFLGEKWVNSVQVIQLISIYGIFMSVGSILPQVYKALGRPDIYLKYVAVRFAVALPVYFYTVPMGLKAISAAHLVLTALFFPINVCIGMRIMSIPVKKLFETLWVSILGAMGVAFLGLFLQAVLLSDSKLPSLAALILTVGIVSVSNISLVYFVRKETFREMNHLFLKIIAK